MNYLIFTRLCNEMGSGYKIRAEMDLNPENYHSIKFYGYSKREAEKRYREFFNLRGKHFIKIGI